MYSSPANLGGNIVISNTARDGGGLFLDFSDATLINNVVADNRTGLAGSGLYIRCSSPHLLHTTLARNTGGDGSGVCVTCGGERAGVRVGASRYHVWANVGWSSDRAWWADHLDAGHHRTRRRLDGDSRRHCGDGLCRAANQRGGGYDRGGGGGRRERPARARATGGHTIAIGAGVTPPLVAQEAILRIGSL